MDGSTAWVPLLRSVHWPCSHTPAQGLWGEAGGHRTAQCRVKVGSADPGEARLASPSSLTFMQDLSASPRVAPSNVRAARFWGAGRGHSQTLPEG